MGTAIREYGTFGFQSSNVVKSFKVHLSKLQSNFFREYTYTI